MICVWILLGKILRKDFGRSVNRIRNKKGTDLQIAGLRLKFRTNKDNYKGLFDFTQVFCYNIHSLAKPASSVEEVVLCQYMKHCL